MRRTKKDSAIVAEASPIEQVLPAKKPRKSAAKQLQPSAEAGRIELATAEATISTIAVEPAIEKEALLPIAEQFAKKSTNPKPKPTTKPIAAKKQPPKKKGSSAISAETLHEVPVLPPIAPPLPTESISKTVTAPSPTPKALGQEKSSVINKKNSKNKKGTKRNVEPSVSSEAETSQTDVALVIQQSIEPQVSATSPNPEDPLIPTLSDEMKKLLLQEIDLRYGGEKPKQHAQKFIKTPENLNAKPTLIESTPSTLVEDKNTSTETDQELPKLSYWQQRRLNKKLKQKQLREQEVPQIEPEPEPLPIQPTGTELSFTQQIEPETQSIQHNEIEHPLVQQPVEQEDTKQTLLQTQETTSEQEPPKLSYWQQRRLNKKLKLQQLREQQPLPEPQNQEVSEKVETEPTPVSAVEDIVPLSQENTAPIIQENDISSSTPEEPQRLSYWQQRRLQRKLKKQQQFSQEVTPLAIETEPIIEITPIPEEIIVPKSIENIATDTIITEIQEEPRKLSYWQQKRLQRKLKQQQEQELKAIDPTSDSTIIVSKTGSEVVVPLSIPEKKILPVPADKLLPQKGKKEQPTNEKKILPVPADKLLPRKDKIAETTTPVPADKLLPQKGKKEQPTNEKKILPVPADKLLPRKDKIAEPTTPVPADKLLPQKGKKEQPTNEKKILPVPADKLLPRKDKKAEPTTNEKKILPVPADKLLPQRENKVLPSVPRNELQKVDLAALKSTPKPPKPQFPKRPKAPLPALPEELSAIVHRAEEYIINQLHVHSDSTILLAVSGGIDSIVMLDIMAYIALKHNFLLHVAHCNHHLRGNESIEDEKLVRRTAANYGFHFHHTSLKVEEFATKHKMSIEQAARNLRYQFFERMAKTTQSELVATAHTADDSAETFLLNLLRGTGLTGLAGIPSRRELTKKIHIIRPLLPLQKSELYQYATIRGLHWREDASNTSLLYTRNKIRLQLLPTLKEQFTPAIVEILNRTARLLHGADEIITEKVDAMLPKLLRTIDKTTHALSIPYFDSLNDFLKGEILQKILVEKYQSQPVSMHTIDRIIALSQSSVNALCEITPSITALRDRTEIIFQRNESIEEIEYNIGKISELKTESFHLVLKEISRKEVQFSENPNIEFFDADLLPLWLTVRTWQNGDRIQPLGMSGTMTVGDFLTNEKVTLIEKKKCLVVCAGTEVIWICSRRVSDKFKVTSMTKRVIQAEFILKYPQLAK